LIWGVSELDMKNKAVFLDRDGTLNKDSIDYIKHLSEYEIFDFTPEALRILQKMGFKLVVITNQSVIARGMSSTKEVESIHNFLTNELKKHGVTLDGIYYCPHHPDDNCPCRKPETGNIEKAIKDHNIDPIRSYFIGDSKRDIEAGKKVGCKTILVLTGERIKSPDETTNWNIKPDHVTKDLLEAAKLIQKIESNK